MPDILDDLRAELDSAFERADDATDAQRHRRRWSGPVARRPAGPDAAVRVRELPPAHGPAGPHRRSRGVMILAPVAAAALAVAVLVAPALNRERIPADERAVPSQTATPMSPTPRATDPGPAAESFSEYGPVDATVYVSGRRQVTIDKGLGDGIHRGDPVIDGAGLVGTVTKSLGGSAIVRLITDPSFATSVYAGRDRHPGSITTATEPSGDLLFEPVDADAGVRMNDVVYTAGTTDLAVPSRYPRAIPVGRVSRVDLGDGRLDRQIYVTPAADLLRLEEVQVLTDPHAELKPEAPAPTATPTSTAALDEQQPGAHRLEVAFAVAQVFA